MSDISNISSKELPVVIFIFLLMACLSPIEAQELTLTTHTITTGSQVASSDNIILHGNTGTIEYTTSNGANTSLSGGFWPTVYLNTGNTSTNTETADATLPESYSLNPNYPNPFNPKTKISYSLPEAAEVKLAVYDMLGRQIKVLVDKYQHAGNYKATFQTNTLSSGTYIYRLEAGKYSEVMKMTLVK